MDEVSYLKLKLVSMEENHSNTHPQDPTDAKQNKAEVWDVNKLPGSFKESKTASYFGVGINDVKYFFYLTFAKQRSLLHLPLKTKRFIRMCKHKAAEFTRLKTPALHTTDGF